MGWANIEVRKYSPGPHDLGHIQLEQIPMLTSVTVNPLTKISVSKIPALTFEDLHDSSRQIDSSLEFLHPSVDDSADFYPWHLRPILNREFEFDLLARQLLVDRGEGLNLVFHIAFFIRVKVHLDNFGTV